MKEILFKALGVVLVLLALSMVYGMLAGIARPLPVTYELISLGLFGLLIWGGVRAWRMK